MNHLTFSHFESIISAKAIGVAKMSSTNPEIAISMSIFCNSLPSIIILLDESRRDVKMKAQMPWI